MEMSTPPNPHHIAQLLKGVAAWNAWRDQYPDETPRLRGVLLKQRSLQGINLRGADLYTASFWRSTLDGADLSGADLSSVTMNGVSLRGANLRHANLRFARLVAANVDGATFSGSHVYGCSIWNLQGSPKEQLDVVITPRNEPQVTVDDLQVAQFVYLMMNNNTVRNALDVMASKAVLLLGRFTPTCKRVLHAIRNQLRSREPAYIPILFDFEPLRNQTLIQTVATLAHMVRFIVADITEARSVIHELAAAVPAIPMVPIQPIILASSGAPWPTAEDLFVRPSVLPLFRYTTLPHLLASLESDVIGPAEAKANEQCERLRQVRNALSEAAS